MDRIKLGRSDLQVSRLCLGTMGWGSRNTEAEGHAQMDAALAGGINFVDTAEVYPAYPVKAETVGRTEEIVGSWIAKTGRRDDIVLATKVAAPNQGAVRDGEGYSGDIVQRTVDGSLKRLQTDVIDLYQTHFPLRPQYHMRAQWKYNPERIDRAAIEAHMIDLMGGMQRLIEAGKIRHWGLSNETAWGLTTWVRVAEENGLPRPLTIQNEYSILHRIADTDLAEACLAEDVPQIPFSPLGMGLISGKYGPELTPEKTRRAQESTLNGRINPKVWPAIEAYIAIAKRHGMDPSAMALAWALTRHSVASPIFGASSVEHVEIALQGGELTLSDEVLEQIDEANRMHPNPF